jgi:hypothetical protein
LPQKTHDKHQKAAKFPYISIKTIAWLGPTPFAFGFAHLVKTHYPALLKIDLSDPAFTGGGGLGRIHRLKVSG